MLGRTLILKTAALKPVEALVRKSFLFRPLVHRFIAGDTLEESLKPAESLLGHGLNVSLDYLGENTQSEAEALHAKATYVQMLDRIAQVPGVAAVAPFGSVEEGSGDVQTLVRPGLFRAESLNISIKLTQCGLDQGTDFAERNYREVVDVALKHGNFVRVDMEGSEYTERTVQMVERVWRDLPATGTVLQSYLHRTDDDVERLAGAGMRIRLVKGAYLEPATVAIQDKAKVDEAYVRQAKRLLDLGCYPAIATHDEAIIREVKRHAEQNGIPRTAFEFQMLFGIRRDLQDSLHAEGYPVRVYVPYGDSWYPYFTRRLAERPANGFFILKSMLKK